MERSKSSIHAPPDINILVHQRRIFLQLDQMMKITKKRTDLSWKSSSEIPVSFWPPTSNFQGWDSVFSSFGVQLQQLDKCLAIIRSQECQKKLVQLFLVQKGRLEERRKVVQPTELENLRAQEDGLGRTIAYFGKMHFLLLITNFMVWKKTIISTNLSSGISALLMLVFPASQQIWPTNSFDKRTNSSGDLN